ncbi:unnamed protein product [Notodromas monacha]|uniref:Xenotropic and polytropic retrovirus receptor 1 n=1 Tax=Notodromas monacha TaxID=399045 RepID=A0A7R9BPU1_9CRUS|nr:unnamed protein product [Notodromas monacha]CAG0919218.1 unnamed protein product [Notodromas monacha]
MKFAEHLSAHITPEWRKQYILYEEMKGLLYAAMEGAPSSEIVTEGEIKSYFAKMDEQFFHQAEKELFKINTFFSEKLAEANRRFAGLKSDLASAHQEPGSNDGRGGFVGLFSRSGTRKKDSELKLAFSEFYLSLILLQNYQNLNFTGFRKILKKHDKLFCSDSGARWRVENVESSHFSINKDINKLIQETENLVTHELEGGNRGRAMKRLRVPPLGDQHSPWTTFKVGLFLGAFLVLLFVVALSAAFRDTGIDWRVGIRLYRGQFLVFLMVFLVGVNVYGWRTSGVNHVLIFELDPRNHISEQHLMELAAVFGVMWCVSVLGFLYSDALGMPMFSHPVILAGAMVAFLINPFRVMLYDARIWFLRILGRVVCAPLFFVNFADFWLGDQLNSLVPAITDFEYFICFYASNGGNWSKVAGGAGRCVNKNYLIRPVVGCLPAWFRFAQCLRRYRDTREAFPHLVNAGKYSTTFFVILLSTLNSENKDEFSSADKNPYFYLWILASIVSSCYAYTWDVRMDWGLLESSSGDNKFLREEIVYPHRGHYYLAIVTDFLLRFGWAISLSLIEMGYVHGDLMVTVLAPMEVIRYRNHLKYIKLCTIFRFVPLRLFVSSSRLILPHCVFSLLFFSTFVPLFSRCCGISNGFFLSVFLGCAFAFCLSYADWDRRFVWNFFRVENEMLNNCGDFRRKKDVMFYETLEGSSSHEFGLVVRRFVWNFFRLENEHLNNCGQFRAVRDIGIKPMNDSDQALMVRMMDDPESVIHVRHRRAAAAAAAARSKGKGVGRDGVKLPLLGVGGAEGNESDPYATVSSMSSVRQWLMSIGGNAKPSTA